MWLPFIFYGGNFSPVLLTIFATVLVLVDILSEWLETYRCNFDSQNSSMALHPCINSEEIHNLTSIRFMEYCDRPTQVIWCKQKHLHFLLLFIRTREVTLKKSDVFSNFFSLNFSCWNNKYSIHASYGFDYSSVSHSSANLMLRFHTFRLNWEKVSQITYGVFHFTDWNEECNLVEVFIIF